MRESFFTALVALLLMSCSSPSNEQKALRLIEPEVKSHLLKPESYKFSEIQLDSCFADDPTHNPKSFVFAIKLSSLYKEYKNFAKEAEHALSLKSIYSPSRGYYSEHEKVQYNKYNKEYEIVKRKADDRKAQIISLYKSNVDLFKASVNGKHEFLGWAALFFYTAETAGGYESSGSKLLFLDKDLKKITYSFGEEDVKGLEDNPIEDVQYEFEEEIKAALGQNDSN